MAKGSGNFPIDLAAVSAFAVDHKTNMTMWKRDNQITYRCTSRALTFIDL
jgi:hypothetical protein